MCDTIVATGDITADGITIFGKNSDREPNEAQHLLFVPAQDHAPGTRLRCTYIDIPQVSHTFAVLLSKPFQIWGAEMGANEHGVTIGNEAIFSRLPAQKNGGLLGMDLLRLGLERAATARQAVEVITGLLTEWGQGGSGGFAHPFYYHNSYLIADPKDAWVLETVDRHWAAKQVRGVYTISNALTLGSEWDLASEDLVNFAVKKGWCKGREDFHFARCYTDPLYTTFGAGAYRQGCTLRTLAGKKGRLAVQDVMSSLRDHGEWSRGAVSEQRMTPGDLRYSQGPAADLKGRPPKPWKPDHGVLKGITVCMHVGWGPVRINQTTGSQVSHLHPHRPTHFFTATAAPCTSLFKPVWLDAAAAAGLPDTGPQPTGSYDPEALFWQHEKLHRATLLDYPVRSAVYAAEKEALEVDFVERALACAAEPVEVRAALSQELFAAARAAEARWLEMVRAVPLSSRPGLLFRSAWAGFNRSAGIKIGS
jgi:dipeptidase